MPETARLAYRIQKHAARRLHYDVRLELGGVLKSWAVTRGPSLVAGARRLAVAVEDHGLDYADYEGLIAPGRYGAGVVLLWDRGHWVPEDSDPRSALDSGSLAFTLHGEKLRGRWRLMRMTTRGRARQVSWLLVKSRDEAARGPGAPDILDEQPRSVLTGRTIEEIAAAAV